MDKFPSRERSAAATLEPRVSAIVVVQNLQVRTNGQAPLDLCLRSAMAEPWIDDLIIVDHGCVAEVSSALRAMQLDRRDTKVLAIDAKASAAAAANLGVQHARGRWLLFLDPGVVLQRGAVERMAAAGGDVQGPWIVGGRLTDLEGRERRAVRPGSLNTFSAIAVAMDWPARKPPKRRRATESGERVGAVSGAFMLIPRGDFQSLDGFDESFLGDYADLDLCRRAAAAGGSVLFQPEASGVQFECRRNGRKQVQGLALFAVKSARTPFEKAFALVAHPALGVLLGLKDFVAGRPPSRR